MEKKTEHTMTAYVNSFFLVLAIALLFLAFEAIGSNPKLEGAVGGAYTANALPIAEINLLQIIIIGCTGLLLVGTLFLLEIKLDRAATNA